jgi:uncharacterized phage protein (TIGR02220 family)
MEEKPSYYAIIPADVRYDENLKMSEKMMYGEITCLSSKTGECWASNNYFAKLYHVTPQAISKWIKNLENNHYISISYEKEDKVITKRIIKMVSTTIDRVSTDVNGGINYSLGGYQHTIKENNININNTSNNNIKEIVDYLNAKLGTNYKNTTKQTQSMINARFKEGFTVEDFKKVIDKKYKEWRNTEFEQYLTPQTLFGTKFEKYLNQKTTKEVDPYAGVPRL